MQMVRRLVSRQPLWAFLVLAYAWSWLVWVPGVLRDRSDLAMAIGAYGPTVAALVVTFLTEGGQGARALLQTFVRWRVGIWWYGAAVVAPYFPTITLLAIYVLRGG